MAQVDVEEETQDDIVNRLEEEIQRHHARGRELMHGYTKYKEEGCRCTICGQAYEDSLETDEAEEVTAPGESATPGATTPDDRSTDDSPVAAEAADQTRHERSTRGIAPTGILAVLQEIALAGVITSDSRSNAVSHQLAKRLPEMRMLDLRNSLVRLEARGWITATRHNTKWIATVRTTATGRQELRAAGLASAPPPH